MGRPRRPSSAWTSAFCLTILTVKIDSRQLLEPGPCEPILIPMCQDLRYNLTRMPSFLGHRAQEEAAEDILGYKLLVDAGCSENMRFFLCSLFAPMCSPEVDVIIPSCQSICLQVMNDCLPTLRGFNYDWPQKLNCSRLPIPSKSLCMEPKDAASSAGPKSTIAAFPRRPIDPPNRNSLAETDPGWPLPPPRPGVWSNFDTPSTVTRVVDEPANDGTCPPNYSPIRRQSVQIVDCVPKCGFEAVFSEKDKNFAEVWMTVWAALCLASTTFTVCTFWIDMDRFQYPERAVVFLSLCLGAYSVAYLVRVVLGPSKTSCDGDVLIRGGADGAGVGENSACVVVFLILYFFGSAACVWWVVLTATWFLAAGRKWSSESIRSLATYFHVAAWALPAAFCVAVVSLKLVDADELTGMCYVGGGGENGAALMGFVVAPLLTFFVVGAAFIILGFSALVKIRRALKRRVRTTATNVAKLETLMVKILVFSVLYAIAAVCVIGCWVFEWRNREDWAKQALADSRECAAQSADWEDCWIKRRRRGTAEVPNLRIFMSLVIGVTSSMWVWSYKTWASWKRWILTTFCCRRPGHGTGIGMTVKGGLLQASVARRGAPLAEVDPRANRFPLLPQGGDAPLALHSNAPHNAGGVHLAPTAVPLMEHRFTSPQI